MTSVSITIHRAANEIGGNCIEIATGDGHRLLLDAGRPLDTAEREPTPVPSTLDLSRVPDAVVLSHGHQDHMGMLRQLPESWPVWCGAPTGRLMGLLGDILGQQIPQRLSHWESGREYRVGPFHLTPFLTDHSAFDAHMILVRVHGQSILYTGDFRDHGRKGGLIPGILARLPRLDALVIEGTNLGSGKSVCPESLLELDFHDCFTTTPGRVFISWSAMNIDRTVTIYKACRKAKRTLAVDLYTAAVLRAVAGDGRIPQPEWPGIRVVVTAALARRLEGLGRGGLLQELLQCRRALSAKALTKTPSKWAVLTRGSLARSYRRSGLLPTTEDAWVWSQWSGYLTGVDGLLQKEYFNSCEPRRIHTSGHASERCLKGFATATASRRVIPVHGENWDKSPHGLANVMRLLDGQTLDL